MKAANFSVLLADVERRDQERTWEISEAWLQQALQDTDALPVAGSSGQVEAHLSRNGRQILVRGRARTRVILPCARTLEPIEIDLDAEIYLLLSQRAASTGPTEGGSPPGRRRRRRAEAPEANARAEAAQSKRKGSAVRGVHSESLPEADAAEDYFEGENIVLDDFVREHILLELPMFPVRSDLRSDPAPAIGPPADTAPEQTAKPARPLDPRLAPLAAIAAELKKKDKE